MNDFYLCLSCAITERKKKRVHQMQKKKIVSIEKTNQQKIKAKLDYHQKKKKDI